jgi:hypothetical protein
MDRFVLKIAKYKSGAQLNKALQHCTRQFMPDNADPMYSFLNRISGDADPIRFPTKRRNGVAAIEVIISASREWAGFEFGSEAWAEFQAAAERFFHRRFGGAPMLATEHADETTPHLHLFYSPAALGTTAKALVGGVKYRLMELQSEFEQEVAAVYGLTHIPRSVPSHATLRNFYSTFDDANHEEPWRVISRRELFRLQYLASHATEVQRRDADLQVRNQRFDLQYAPDDDDNESETLQQLR